MAMTSTDLETVRARVAVDRLNALQPGPHGLSVEAGAARP